MHASPEHLRHFCEAPLIRYPLTYSTVVAGFEMAASKSGCHKRSGPDSKEKQMAWLLN